MPLFGPPNVEKMEEKHDVKGLIKALSHRRQNGPPHSATDTDVRQRAAEALGRVSDPGAVDALADVLRDEREDAPPRRAAAEALGRIHDTRAVKVLTQELTCRHQDIRDAVVDALIAAGEPAVEPLIAAVKVGDVHARRAAADTLCKIGGARVAGALAKVLRDKDLYTSERGREVLKAVVQALVNTGKAAVVPLRAECRHKDPRVREQAVQALGQIGDPRGVEPLIAALHDTDLGVRRAALRALGRTGDPRAVEALVAALKDEQFDVRTNAALALGAMGDPRAVEPLIAALKDSNGFVCQAAAEALGQIGDSRAVEPLIATLKAVGSAAHWAAVRALGDIGDPRAVTMLITELRVDNPEAREAAARALSQIGDARAVEPLIAIVDGRAGKYRRSAARALVEMYRNRQLDADSKRLILAVGGILSSPHHDEDPNCGHHDNAGAGVDLPL